MTSATFRLLFTAGIEVQNTKMSKSYKREKNSMHASSLSNIPGSIKNNILIASSFLKKIISASMTEIASSA
jgi:hypothetical protein